MNQNNLEKTALVEQYKKRIIQKGKYHLGMVAGVFGFFHMMPGCHYAIKPLYRELRLKGVLPYSRREWHMLQHHRKMTDEEWYMYNIYLILDRAFPMIHINTGGND